MNNKEITNLIRKAASLQKEMKENRLDMVKAVVLIGVPQEEAMKIDVRAFLDGYLMALGSAPQHRGV